MMLLKFYDNLKKNDIIYVSYKYLAQITRKQDLFIIILRNFNQK